MPDQQPKRNPSLLLAVVGLALMVVAIAGYIANKSEAVTGTFLLFGVVSIVAAVFFPRMEGQFKVTAEGLEGNLASVIAAGEDEIAAGRSDELPAPDQPAIEDSVNDSPTDEATSGSDPAEAEREPAGRNPGSHTPVRGARARPAVAVHIVEDAQDTVRAFGPMEYQMFLRMVEQEFHGHAPNGKLVESTRGDGRKYFALKVPSTTLRVVYREMTPDEIGHPEDPEMKGYAILAIVDTAREVI